MISSLISLARRPIYEQIPGLQCADYHLEACKEDVPSILLVGDSHYYKPDIEGHNDMVFVPSEQIVRSLVHMHITSQLAYSIEQHPALFCIPNKEVGLKSLKEEYKELILNSLAKQRKWFVSLVQIADDDWQQAHRHHMISDIQRTAARELGLKREWLMTIEDESITLKDQCPFCGTGLLNPNAPICPSCGKVHNPVRLAELEKRLIAGGLDLKKVN